MAGRDIHQGQLDRLFTAALEAGIARIEKDGHFYPLVFELRANGVIQNVAVLDLASVNGAESVMDRLAELLRPRAEEGTILAAAIIQHRAAENSFQLQLRAPNYSQDVTIPFEIAREGVIRRRRRVSLGEFAAVPADNAIF